MRQKNTRIMWGVIGISKTVHIYREALKFRQLIRKTPNPTQEGRVENFDKCAGRRGIYHSRQRIKVVHSVITFFKSQLIFVHLSQRADVHNTQLT